MKLSTSTITACVAALAVVAAVADIACGQAIPLTGDLPSRVLDQKLVDADVELASCCGDDCGCGDELGCGCGDTLDGCGSVCGAKKKADKPNPCLKSHKGLFYANDFSYLNDPCYRGDCLGDCMKQMPVDRCGRFGKLDVGGQLRLRYHDEEGMGRARRLANPDGFLDTENTFLLSRVRLYGDYKANDFIRVYVEGIFADATGNTDYDFRGIDRNFGDLLNAFVDVKVVEDLTIRVGRQELLYGSQRVVSPLDWANTRRTFEGIRGLYKHGDWTIDAFYTNFVPVVPNEFDEADYDRSFYGLYSVYSGLESSTVDLYYLGFDDERIGVGGAGGSDFSLHTFGGRLNGKLAGKWLYDVEGAYQGGRQSGLGLDHDAGFITAGVGRKVTNWCWDPTLWFYFDYASGDAGGGDFNSFNQLFPLAHKYLGFIDAVARTNIVSPNVLLTMKPHKKWSLLLWYYYFDAAEEGAPIPGVAVPSAQDLAEDNFGQELDFLAKYQITPRSDIWFGWSHLWAGDRIIGTDDANFFYAQWQLNF